MVYENAKGLFEFAISIIYNSKMVGPIAEKSVWFLFQVVSSF